MAWFAILNSGAAPVATTNAGTATAMTAPAASAAELSNRNGGGLGMPIINLTACAGCAMTAMSEIPLTAATAATRLPMSVRIASTVPPASAAIGAAAPAMP